MPISKKHRTLFHHFSVSQCTRPVGSPGAQAVINMRIRSAWLFALAAAVPIEHPHAGLSSRCAKSLRPLLILPITGGSFDYVCDTTVPWLHHLESTGEWAAATPSQGTGCHEYVAYAGIPPAGCTVGAECSACASPGGEAMAAVKLNGDSCEFCHGRRLDSPSAVTAAASSCSKSIEPLLQQVTVGGGGWKIVEDYDYVCDTTAGWLHHLKSSGEWAAATPPEGSGCHEYVAFLGTPPAGCTVGAECSACRTPGGKRVMSVAVDGSSCEVCPEGGYAFEM